MSNDSGVSTPEDNPLQAWSPGLCKDRLGDWRGALAEEGGMVWRIKLKDTTQTSR